MTSALDKMGLVNSLICRGDGIPLPRVTRWEKDSKPLPVHADFQIKPGKTSHQERLNIHNFGLEHLGVYNCFVSNEVGSSSCVINVAGKYGVPQVTPQDRCNLSTICFATIRMTKVKYFNHF